MIKDRIASRREFLQLSSKIAGVAAFGSALGVGAGTVARAQSGNPMPINIAYPSTSGAMVPLWLAHEEGIFAKHNLAAKIVHIAPNSITAALISNQIDVAIQSPTALITANVNGGADLVYIGLEQNRSPYSFIVSKDIQKPEDLKGKAIGTDRPGTGADFRTGAFLEFLGLTEKDVRLLQLGGPDVVSAAMVSGQIAGTALVPPFTFRLEAQGFRIIAEGTSLSGADFSFGPMVNRARIGENAAALQAFTNAFKEAMQLYFDQPELAKKILSKYSKEENPDVLQKTWQLYANVFNPSLAMDPAPLQALIDYLSGNVLPAAKGVKAERFIDSRFLS